MNGNVRTKQTSASPSRNISPVRRECHLPPRNTCLRQRTYSGKAEPTAAAALPGRHRRRGSGQLSALRPMPRRNWPGTRSTTDSSLAAPATSIKCSPLKCRSTATNSTTGRRRSISRRCRVPVSRLSHQRHPVSVPALPGGPAPPSIIHSSEQQAAGPVRSARRRLDELRLDGNPNGLGNYPWPRFRQQPDQGDLPVGEYPGPFDLHRSAILGASSVRILGYNFTLYLRTELLRQKGRPSRAGE